METDQPDSLLAVVTVEARPGEELLRTEDIVSAIQAYAPMQNPAPPPFDWTCMLLLSGGGRQPCGCLFGYRAVLLCVV